MAAEFSHLDAQNQPGMVDVGAKNSTTREAKAQSVVYLGAEIIQHFQEIKAHVVVLAQGKLADDGGDVHLLRTHIHFAQKLVDPGGAEGHAGPFGMHTAALPLLFWPGTLLLIPGIWLAVTKLWPRKTATGPETTRTAIAQAWEEREAMAWRFVACWVVPSWIVFEIAPTKLVHYTLPMYPALALMAGAAADRWFSTNDWKQGRWVSIALFGVVTAVLALAASPWALSAIRADAAVALELAKLGAAAVYTFRSPRSYTIHAMRSAFRADASVSGDAGDMNCSMVALPAPCASTALANNGLASAPTVSASWPSTVPTRPRSASSASSLCSARRFLVLGLEMLTVT